jgi:hypothetical protein
MYIYVDIWVYVVYDTIIAVYVKKEIVSHTLTNKHVFF